MQNVKKLKEPPGRVRYLSQEEINRLLRVSAPHLKPIIITALTTGMRLSEILNLKWEEVNLKRKTIVLRKTKNNEVRLIPINGFLFKTLTNLPSLGKSKWLFPGEDGKPMGSVKTAFKTALKRAGIKNFRFHDLRHTFAAYLVMNGANLRTVQLLLGHKDIKMTMRYSHLSQALIKEEVEKLGKAFQQITTYTNT